MANVLSAAEAELRMSLYRQGLNDTRIAEMQGVTSVAVAIWRRRRNLPVNPSIRSKRQSKNYEEIRSLYERNQSDAQIARALGIRPGAVREWRKRNGLPTTDNSIRHFLSPERNAARLALYRQGLNDAEIARRQNVTPMSVTGWRWRRKLPANGTSSTPQAYTRLDPLQIKVKKAVGAGLPPDALDDIVSSLVLAILEGKVAESEISQMARKYRSAFFRDQQFLARARSFDALVPGRERHRYCDIIPDETQTAWLIEMGASITSPLNGARGCV